VRLSIVLLIAALAGVLGGGWLISRAALGGCVIFDSLAVGAYAWFRDVGTGKPRPGAVPEDVPKTLAQVFDRARRAS